MGAEPWRGDERFYGRQAGASGLALSGPLPRPLPQRLGEGSWCRDLSRFCPRFHWLAGGPGLGSPAEVWQPLDSAGRGLRWFAMHGRWE
jgi:hypothetical protein